MIKTTVLINQATKDFVANNYENQSQGFEYSINNYIQIRQNTLRELKGVFTREELISFLDMYNGTIYDPRFAGTQFLIAQIEDAENFENTISRQGATLEDILSKVKSLTFAQSVVLVEECWRFWYANKENKSIDEFVNSLL